MSEPGSGPIDSPLRGITFMVLSVLALSVMDGVAKWLVAVLPILQLLAIRSALNLVLLTPLVVQGGGLPALRTRRLAGHGLRVAISVAALLCFFEALRNLPLATCIAIGFSAPLYMAVISVFLLREHVGTHRWSAIIVGFLGVLIIVPPDAQGLLSWGGALMVISSFLFAVGQVLVRWLTRSETDAAILVYQNSGMLLAGLIGLPFVWTPVSLTELGGIAAMSGALTLGQVFTVKSFRAAPVAVVAPFQYTELIWAALIGYVFWSELPEPHVWTGAAVVVLCGLYMLWREAKAAPSPLAMAPSPPRQHRPAP